MRNCVSNLILVKENKTKPQPHSSSSSQDIKAFYSSLTCFKSLDELFPPTTTVFMVGNPYYGAMGEVCKHFSA